MPFIYSKKLLPVLGIAVGKCIQDTEGIKRMKTKHMDFSQYEICSEGGKWMTKTCQRGSMFWTIVSCCIPLGNFPVIDNCI